MIFLDTNVLLYSALPPASDEDLSKRAIAHQLLDRDDCRLSMQVLQEFVNQATRTTRINRLPNERAIALALTWRRFPIQDTTPDVFDLGLVLWQREKLSYWDAMIVAAARASGCTTLYTEDMQDGRIIDRLHIVNPFL